MTPEPCPTCKGFCCWRVENGLPIPHSVATLYIRHVCPDCDDGTYEICSEPEPFVPQRTYEQGIAEGERRAQEAFRADIERYGSQLEAAHDRGVAEERAAVVAWLEELSASSMNHDPVEELLYAARSIERGEHRREGGEVTETLARDKHGHLSSQPVVKSGPNRGKRLPETAGRWAYLCGCLIRNYDQSVVCGEVVRSLTREGFRLGHHDDDGVRSFYLWCGEHRREEE